MIMLKGTQMPIIRAAGWREWGESAVRTAVTPGRVKRPWCVEPSFKLFLPSIMCFCLLPCLQSVTSQVPFTAFDSLSQEAQKGIAGQFKYSLHGFDTGPRLLTATLCPLYPGKYDRHQKEATIPLDCSCHFLRSHSSISLHFDYKYISHLNVDGKWWKLAALDWVYWV